MTTGFKGAARSIAGRHYVLVMHFSHLSVLQKDHPDIMSGALQDARLKDTAHFRAIFAMGLKGQVKTDKQVDDLITHLTINGAVKWLGESLAVAFGTMEGETANPVQAQPQASNGTGPQSLPSGWNWGVILRLFGFKRP